MVGLGFLLILAGALVVLAAVLTGSDASGSLELLGLQVSPLSLFFLGVGSAVAILTGISLVRGGTRRAMAQRKERKRAEKLSRHGDGAGRSPDVGSGR